MADEAITSYYERMKADSQPSAQRVVPILMEMVEPRSVVDVGCGTGSWLKVFQEQGVADVFGLDGDWVPREKLEIGEEQFQVADVFGELGVERRFDLALCLEVAQTNPPESGAGLVANLAQLAPFVLFSAAIPGSAGGRENQRWPAYWAARFADHGYACIDCVRPRIWDERDVKSWYIQTALLYVDRVVLEQRPRLADAHERAQGRPLNVVHPRVFLAHRRRLAEAEALLEAALAERAPSSRGTGEF
jgi:SAM-dependent methyltransferase